MIFLTHRLPVNVPGEPHLDRAAVWRGLVRKANNALPFVASMSSCEVLERRGETSFDREIETRSGRKHTERVTLEPSHRVLFTRIAGPILGVIANEIEGPDDDLHLRFSFAIVMPGVESNTSTEREYANSLTAEYQRAIEATLAAMRRIAKEEATTAGLPA
jgi:hypothetical protein